MRSKRRFSVLIGIAAAAAALLVGVESAFAAFVPGDPNQVNETQVRTAVDRGSAYLLSQQLPSGCWQSDGVTVGVTALAILALSNSQPGGYANLNAATQAAVQKGAQCLVTYQLSTGQFNEPCCLLWVYGTSTAIWALSSLPAPTYNTNIANGRNWLLGNQCNQAPAGRADLGGWQDNGGWHYEGGCSSFVEHSNSSFALQGLEATGGIPAAIKDLAQGFWICLQRLQPYPAAPATCMNGGGPNDGGYIYSHELNKGGTQTSATGSGSFSLSLTGLAHNDPRVLATIRYLDASINFSPCENNYHNSTDLTTGWTPTNDLRHYAAWANFKAHELAGIADSLSDPNNYYYKLADCLVNENIASPLGNWPRTGREDEILATAFAMLTLEKVTPEPPIANATGVLFRAVEGTNSCGTVTTFTDADSRAVVGDYTATIAWGDGTTSPGTITGAGGNFTVTGCHAYSEEGSSTITVTITDADNAANNATVTATATITDAALASTCLVPATISPTFAGPTATFTDASSTGTLSDFTATIAWGDATSSPGTIAGGPGVAPYTVSGTHIYTTTGPFTITTTITDVGGSTTKTACGTTVTAVTSCDEHDGQGDINDNDDQQAGNNRDQQVDTNQNRKVSNQNDDQDRNVSNQNEDQDRNVSNENDNHQCGEDQDEAGEMEDENQQQGNSHRNLD